jgi:hypothetical protein
MAIIEARGLARDFTSRKRTVHAVRGVDITVEEGRSSASSGQMARARRVSDFDISCRLRGWPALVPGRWHVGPLRTQGCDGALAWCRRCLRSLPAPAAIAAARNTAGASADPARTEIRNCPG